MSLKTIFSYAIKDLYGFINSFISSNIHFVHTIVVFFLVNLLRNSENLNTLPSIYSFTCSNNNLLNKITIPHIMYPKVKVRVVEQDDEFASPRSPLQGFNSLSIRDSTTPVKGVKHPSSVSVAKVPRSYVPRSITPPPSLPKPAKKSETEEDGIKPHIRASSIPRPRAVISSPDNDQILGTKYQKRSQRPSTLKIHDLAQSKQLEGKCTQMSPTSASKNYNLPQRRQTGGKCTQASTTSTLKTHNQAQSRQSDGRCTLTSTASTLKGHNLAQTKQSEGKCTQTSTSSKKPLHRGEYNEMTTVSDMKAEGSAIQVRVPVANITKAKPCFMIT